MEVRTKLPASSVLRLFLGDRCMYRHALPPGFVLRSDKKAAEEAAKKEQISLEDFLEVEVRPCAGRMLVEV